ncbi:Type 1 glutamine amidotransferase-like domain-containing protein [Aestuariimicrobium sp. T2.26MG-19.2B]|uniref:Type 1 glutamine amidotransferase-like domain-containing protein n=1 Tax=Aestuariimicrobium sp. T2.26MG-19.2B TaxID=3040679 RepID=UPI002477BD6D|nr:Type 1 glutamine amidotransferase-like domain-containing protein [Aestuariimicrobium sp. T2.26MG-19.2B]CAI9402783.1 Peptidase E [Aestuariimicrobium sp. T2.26MG-19.2B]
MTIHLVGSGAQVEGLDGVWDSFVAEAKRRSGGDGARPIVVCLLELPEDGGLSPEWTAGYTDPILARWPEAPIELVTLRPTEAFLAHPTFGSSTPTPDDATPAQATPAQDATEPSSTPEPVTEPPTPTLPDLSQAAGLVVGGGWTPGYLHCLLPHRDQIARAVRRDLPYLGFSAGASIAARHALVGGQFADGIRVQQEFAAEDLRELTVVDGLALVSALVQVHTDEWSNEGIVISAIERNLAGHAVAIDEGTALVVEPASGRTTRLGRGRLRWFSKESHGVLVHTEEPVRTSDEG